ncbi:MAG: hypothetical protein IJT39_03655 [Bacteroidales bacterium]|nr:hypothetical protein [Bacteroidales bacterium]
MNRDEKRQQVICSCLSQQEQIASIAKQEMDSAQQQSNDYGANVDRYDSYRTKLMRSRDMYAKQLANANASIRVLRELLQQAPHDSADHGAIVETDKQRFFLSIGAGKFLVPHQAPLSQPQETYFAISAQTPIYLALKGHKIGDTIVFNGISQTIQEIY